MAEIIYRSKEASTMALPNPGLQVDGDRTALVITDPQNDFLNPKGVTWGVVGESVTENTTVENIKTLLKTHCTEAHHLISTNEVTGKIVLLACTE